MATPSLMVLCARLLDGGSLEREGVRIRRFGGLYELTARGREVVVVPLAGVEGEAARMRRPHPDLVALWELLAPRMPIAKRIPCACAVSTVCRICGVHFNPVATSGWSLCLSCGRSARRAG